MVDQMAMGLVIFPSNIHCTAVFALKNGKFSSLGMNHPPFLPYVSPLGTHPDNGS